MINTMKCRNDFLLLLQNLNNIENKCILKMVIQQIACLKKYINENYHYDVELPIISHRVVDSIYIDLENIKSALNNLNLSNMYNLKDDVKYELSRIQNLKSQLLMKYKISKAFYPKIYSFDIDNLLEPYIKEFGKKLVIKALQSGLDIFYKERKYIYSPNKINIDGILNEKTKNLINEVVKKYSSSLLEKYLAQGLLSNIIFETKGQDVQNTLSLIKKVYEIKNRR